MSVLDDVFASLRVMNLVQLLLAFVACTGYALAQGELVSAKGRRLAWALAVLAALGFAFESAQWAYAAMLVSFAVAGLGVFIALAWLLSRALGFSRPRAVAEAVEFAQSAEADESILPDTYQPETLQPEAFAPTPSAAMPLGPRSRPAPHSGPAHST